MLFQFVALGFEARNTSHLKVHTYYLFIQKEASIPYIIIAVFNVA